MYGDELVGPWLEELLRLAPGLELFDAHTHIGSNDPDEFTCSSEQLLAALDAAAGARAAVFPMHEPDGYPPANDAVIAEAEAAGGTIPRRPGETFWGGYSGIFVDPDGHPWEIAHNPGWVLEDDGSVRLR